MDDTKESPRTEGEYKGTVIGKEEDGYVIMEKGKKIKKWVDAEGNWQEKEI